MASQGVREPGCGCVRGRSGILPRASIATRGRGLGGSGQQRTNRVLLDLLSCLGSQPVRVCGGRIEFGQSAGDVDNGLKMTCCEHRTQLLLQGRDVTAAGAVDQPGRPGTLAGRLTRPGSGRPRRAGPGLVRLVGPWARMFKAGSAPCCAASGQVVVTVAGAIVVTLWTPTSRRTRTFTSRLARRPLLPRRVALNLPREMAKDACG
jgi:hypothetical protein